MLLPQMQSPNYGQQPAYIPGKNEMLELNKNKYSTYSTYHILIKQSVAHVTYAL